MGVWSRGTPSAVEWMRQRPTQAGPIRVGWIVTPLSPFGGTFTHLCRWYETLDRARIDPTLFYFSPEEARGLPLPLPAGLKRVCVPALDVQSDAPQRAVPALVRALQQAQIEVLHTIYIVSDLVGALSSVLVQKPVISSVEGALLVSSLSPLRRRALELAYRAVSGRFSRILTLSNASSEALRRSIPAHNPPIEILRSSMPWMPLREPPLEGLELLTVGRLAPVKGLPLLVEALERLRGRYPALRWSVVGDGPDRAPLEALVRSRGLERQVTFYGWQSTAEVQAHLARALLLVQPSHAEGLPWSVLEGMACGMPVVASSVGGLSELLVEKPESQRCGFLFEPGRSDRLTMVLAQALEGAEVHHRLAQVGARAQARVRALHGPRQEAERLEQLYQTLAGRKVEPCSSATNASGQEGGEHEG